MIGSFFVCFCLFALEEQKKDTENHLVNGIAFTICQLSSSNCNRNLQALGSLCMATGNLQCAREKGQAILART